MVMALLWVSSSRGGVSGSGSSVRMGMPKPGDKASCSPMTSPKNGRRPPSVEMDVMDAIDAWLCFLDPVVGLLGLGDDGSSMVPLVLRDVDGDGGAGCGLSRGFRLLNLCRPYDVSFDEGRAADGAAVKFSDTDRDGGDGRTVRALVDPAGDDSTEDGWLNFWAMLLTVGRWLTLIWETVRLDVAEEPPARNGGLAVPTAPLDVWRWRVVVIWSAWEDGG